MKKEANYLLILGIAISSVYPASCTNKAPESNSEASMLTTAVTREKSDPLPDSACFLNSSRCADSMCQLEIAKSHIITDSIFNSMQNEYISIYNPKIKSTKYALSRFKRIDSLNCEERDHIGFSTYENDGNILVSINDIIPFNPSNNAPAFLLNLTITPAKTKVRKIKLPEIEAADSTIPEQIILGRYSIALFKGLIATYNLKEADTIEFIKILGYEKDGTRKPTAAMKIINVTGKPVYADLSQYYP